MMLLICARTVFSEMFSSYAITLFCKPRPISVINSCSRGVGVALSWKIKLIGYSISPFPSLQIGLSFACVLQIGLSAVKFRFLHMDVCERRVQSRPGLIDFCLESADRFAPADRDLNLVVKVHVQVCPESCEIRICRPTQYYWADVSPSDCSQFALRL